MFIQFQGIFTIDVYPTISCFRPTSSIIPPWAQQGPSSFWSFGAEGHQRHSSTWRGSICPLGCWKLGSRGLVSPGGRQNMAKNGGSFLPPKIENQLGDVDVFSRMMLVAKSGRRRAGMGFLIIPGNEFKTFQKIPEETVGSFKKLLSDFSSIESRWEHLGLPSSPSHNWQLWRLEDRPNGKLESFIFFFEVNPYADQILNWQAKNALPGSFISSCNSFRFLFPHLQGLKTLSDLLSSVRPSFRLYVRPSFPQQETPHGSAHWDLALAVEVRQCPLRSEARSWDMRDAKGRYVCRKCKRGSVKSSASRFVKTFCYGDMLRPEVMPSVPRGVLLAFPNPDCRTMLHTATRLSGSVTWTWSRTRLNLKGARMLCPKLRPRYPEKLLLLAVEIRGRRRRRGRRKEEATLIKSTDPREEKNVRIDARKIQKECQHICQKVCQNRCQVECQKDCQSICQKDCQKSTYIHISSILILPDGTSETMSG